MLQNVKRILGYKLAATDGEIGRVKDVYFDDQTWTIRYLVADTGNWLPGKQVLISPWALRHVSPAEAHIEVTLTRQQIEDSPPITADLPVSRQHEIEYYQYYGWPMYWYGPALWGPAPFPAYFEAGPNALVPPPPTNHAHSASNPHLRSAGAVIGYQIHARDGEIGHAEDFLFDDENWAIRYLEIDTRNWWPGKKVLVAPQWIERVSWEKSAVYVDLNRKTIEQAPEYDPLSPVSRDYETQLFNHYQREGYWNQDLHLNTSTP